METMMEKINLLNRETDARNQMCLQQKGSEKKVYSVSEIQDILDISRNTAYQLVADPPFKVMKIGGTIRISKAGFDAWLDGKGDPDGIDI